MCRPCSLCRTLLACRKKHTHCNLQGNKSVTACYHLTISNRIDGCCSVRRPGIPGDLLLHLQPSIEKEETRYLLQAQLLIVWHAIVAGQLIFVLEGEVLHVGHLSPSDGWTLLLMLVITEVDVKYRCKCGKNWSGELHTTSS